MDVTPTNKMLTAMRSFVDSTVGAEPSVLEVSAGAIARRMQRRVAMDWLHQFAALSMREGVNRAIKDARARREGHRPDAEDRSAMDKARDDAASDNGMMVEKLA